MRLCALAVVGVATACLASAQTMPPVPADANELVTGVGGAIATNADRTQALALLNKAKRPMRLIAPMTPPYLITVSFTGDAGAGELSQLWLNVRQSRWTASLGNFTLSRVRTGGETFDEKPVSSIPMRVHMLRNTIFWAAGTIAANAKFRSAPVIWNDAPATCLLMSTGADATSPARQWNEEEFCIDDQSGLLRILSFAPGNYTVYSYAKRRSFHDQPMPDRITTYIAGTVAIDANFSIDDPGTASVPQAPTPAMIANGPVVGLQDPAFMHMDVPSSKVSATAEPVIVNAQVGPSGKVLAQEPCATADASLVSEALDLVKGMSFGPSDSQRQFYVSVVFTPAATLSASAHAKAPVARVPLEPYYLERVAEDPAGKAGGPEILARRSDGATMYMTHFGAKDWKLFARDVHFPDGRWVTVYEQAHAKVTWPAPNPIDMQFLRERSVDGPADCAAASSATLLRHDQIEGQDVDVMETSAGERRLTFSAAPRLGCENLAVKSETVQANGTFRTAMETRTTRLVIGEPEARWFEIAPDLVEMKPSEAQRKLLESIDLPMSPEDKAVVFRDVQRMAAAADARYLKNR